MFQPLEWFIGLRYLRSRRRYFVVSFRSAASFLGIAVGVAALIVILSVMNGLETETRTRLLSMSAHATLTDPDGLADWRELEREVRTAPGVVGVSPFVTIEGMLAAGPNLQPALVRGIMPGEPQSAADVGQFMREGSIDALQAGQRKVVLGRVLALNLGVHVGDSVTLLVPRFVEGRVTPRYAAFGVVGLFEVGIQDNDASLALVHMADASDLKGLNGAAEGVEVRLSDPLQVAGFRAAQQAKITGGLRYSDWTEEHRNLFSAIHIEKIMMSIILMFIIAVAAFNIVASLMMVVIDKQKDIAILRTCGLESWRVGRVFLIQGAVIGVVGVLLGTVLGLLIAFNVGVIVPWLEATFHFQIMPGDVYYVTEIPSEVRLTDVLAIPLAALVVSVLATIYPARRAAAVSPASALRYE